jgi:hypothetical protein
MPALTTLDLSYNQIDELSAPLPATITSLALAAQHRQYGKSTIYPGLDSMTALTLNIGKGMTLTLPSILAYSHTAQGFPQHPQMNVYTPDQKTRYGLLKWDNLYERYAYTANSWKQTAVQDEDVMLIVADGSDLAKTALPAQMHFTPGDANLTGWVDVNDVQRTLNYVINSNNSTVFSLWAANTYTAEESELLINIQDIVCTVNIVLENQLSDERQPLPHVPYVAIPSQQTKYFLPDQQPIEAARAQQPTPSTVTCDGRQLLLTTTEPIAALCIELRGVQGDQVKMMLDHRDWQMQTRNTIDGVRLMLFSPTGASLPVCSGQPLLRFAAMAEAVFITASSPEAEKVGIVLDNEATGIRAIDHSPLNIDHSVYDLQGRRMANGQWSTVNGQSLKKGLYINNGKRLIIR